MGRGEGRKGGERGGHDDTRGSCRRGRGRGIYRLGEEGGKGREMRVSLRGQC